MARNFLLVLLWFIVQVSSSHENGRGDQALSQIDIYAINLAQHHSAFIHVSPLVLGSQVNKLSIRPN